jgi:hypothetical protein
VRFRAVYDEDEIGLGWILDDFNVNALTIPVPGTPQNLSISQIGADIRLQWNPVSGVSRYIVYSSDSPSGTFTEDITGVFNGSSWNAPVTSEKKFYRIVAERN